MGRDERLRVVHDVFPIFITRSCLTMTMTKKHILIMLACCLIPLVALAAIFVFKIPATGVIYFGILLLCPVLHLLLMRNMMGPGHDHAGRHQVERPAPRLLRSAPTRPNTNRDAPGPAVSAPSQAIASETMQE